MIKRILQIRNASLLALIIANLSSFGQKDSWTENFDTQSSNSYGSTTITINGRDWTRQDAGNFAYANTYMGSYAFTINDDNAGAHITTPVLNTCGTVGFKYAYINGSSDNVFVLQKSTDGTSFTNLETHTLGTGANLTYVDYSFDVNDASTSLYIRILSDNQNAHLFVEDFYVTDYSGGGSPTITISETTLSGFSYIVGNGPSSEQSFDVEGSNLTADITIVAPTNYEISETSGGTFGSTITLLQSGGSVSLSKIYVRLNANLPIGDYNDEDITLTSTTASETVTLNGTVVGAATGGCATDLIISEINENGNEKYIEIANFTGSSVSLADYDLVIYSNGNTSVSSTIDLTDGSSIADNDVWVLAYSSSFAWTGTPDQTSGSFSPNGNDVIALRKASVNIDVFGTIGNGLYYYDDKTVIRNADITSPTTSYNPADWAFTAYSGDSPADLGLHTMNCGAVPSISINPFTLTGFTYVEGYGPSTEQSFDVEGSDLTADIEITAPSDYEISETTSTGFTNAITLDFGTGTVALTTIYVRLKATLAAGDYNLEEISLTSTDATDKIVYCSGTVLAQEPTNNPSSITATTISEYAISVAWTDSDASAYLIKGSDVSYAAIGTPEDGTEESNAALVQNVASGIETFEFTGLTPSTTYYFKLFSYNGTGSTINYKTDGTIPQDDATTNAPTITSDLMLSALCDPASNYASDRYIQIYNAGTTTEDLSTVSVVAVGNGSDIYTWTLSGSILPGEVKTCGDDENTKFTPDFATTDWSSSNSSWNGKVDDGAKLLIGTTIIDNAATHGNFENKVSVRNQDVTGPAVAYNSSEWTSTGVTYADDAPSIPGNHYCDAPSFTIGPGVWNTLTSSYGIGASYNISGTVTVDNASTSPATCFACTISSGASISVDAGKTLTINGSLTNNAGTSGLVLQSDATGTASLLHSSSGVNATVENYKISGRWHYISLPVSQTTANSFFGMYLMRWFEPTEEWIYITDENSVLDTVMQGFSLWTTSNATVSYTGQLNNGAYAIDVTHNGDPVSQNSSFNFIGNPYPSAADWNQAGWDLTDVDPTIYIWDGAQYGSYNRVSKISTNAVDSILPAHQGFFVACNDETNGDGSVSVDNSVRLHFSHNNYKSNGTKSNTGNNLRFVCNGNGYSDEMVINVEESATLDFDGNYDSYKLNGIEAAPQLYSYTADNKKVAVNSIAAVNKLTSLLVGFEVGEDAMYEISLTDINGFDGIPVYLEDLKEHKVIDIKAVSNYKFYASAEDEAQRFILHFSYTEAPAISETQSTDDIIIYAKDKIINILSTSEMNGDVTVYDLLGRRVFTGSLNNTLTREVSMLDKEGYFIVNVVSENGVLNKKIYLNN
ncbi:MAG: fibronectin type III domain-containing protein [Bacteroidales bacterium]|nr:fibronectin type III domain-containing protein [Bacteroidales bacterium]MCF8403191.1 fibronectin type III domain-containing protein [Bacteroidales bacterium]